MVDLHVQDNHWVNSDSCPALLLLLSLNAPEVFSEGHETANGDFV